MNSKDDNEKSKKPDYYLQLVQEGRNGKEQITDVGALWKSKNDYLTGRTIAGRVIAQPRAAREELQRMREARQSKTEPHFNIPKNGEPEY